MDIRKIITETMANGVLSDFVSPSARDNKDVIAEVNKWASETYDYIESMQKLAEK